MFAPPGTTDMVTVVFVKIGQMTNKQMLNRYQYMNTILMITTITKIIIRSDVARSADTRKTLFVAETARPCLPTAHPTVQYLSSNKSYRPIFVIQQILPSNICHPTNPTVQYFSSKKSYRPIFFIQKILPPNICNPTNPPVQYLSSSISRCPIILIKFVLSNVFIQSSRCPIIFYIICLSHPTQSSVQYIT